MILTSPGYKYPGYETAGSGGQGGVEQQADKDIRVPRRRRSESPSEINCDLTEIRRKKFPTTIGFPPSRELRDQGRETLQRLYLQAPGHRCPGYETAGLGGQGGVEQQADKDIRVPGRRRLESLSDINCSLTEIRRKKFPTYDWVPAFAGMT